MASTSGSLEDMMSNHHHTQNQMMMMSPNVWLIKTLKPSFEHDMQPREGDELQQWVKKRAKALKETYRRGDIVIIWFIKHQHNAPKNHKWVKKKNSDALISEDGNNRLCPGYYYIKSVDSTPHHKQGIITSYTPPSDSEPESINPSSYFVFDADSSPFLSSSTSITTNITESVDISPSHTFVNDSNNPQTPSDFPSPLHLHNSNSNNNFDLNISSNNNSINDASDKKRKKKDAGTYKPHCVRFCKFTVRHGDPNAMMGGDDIETTEGYEEMLDLCGKSVEVKYIDTMQTVPKHILQSPQCVGLHVHIHLTYYDMHIMGEDFHYLPMDPLLEEGMGKEKKGYNDQSFRLPNKLYPKDQADFLWWINSLTRMPVGYSPFSTSPPLSTLHAFPLPAHTNTNSSLAFSPDRKQSPPKHHRPPNNQPLTPHTTLNNIILTPLNTHVNAPISSVSSNQPTIFDRMIQSMINQVKTKDSRVLFSSFSLHKSQDDFSSSPSILQFSSTPLSPNNNTPSSSPLDINMD